MAVQTGKYGVVDGADTVRNWSIAHTSALARGVASNTFAGAARRKGVNSWTGSYTRYGADLLHYPGDVFAFTGYTAPDNGVFGTTGRTWSGDAMVDSVAITWDWTTAAIISQVVSFSGHLVLVRGSAIHVDNTDPVLPEVHGTKIEFGTDVAASPTVWQNLLTATLTLSMPSQPYTNSSTYDATSQKIWTGRKPGIFDWNLSVTVQDNNDAIFPGIEEQLGFRLWVDAAAYWTLLWGRVREYGGLTVDIEGGGIQSLTVPIEMDGFKDGVGAGSVTAPDGTVVWPIAAAP